MNDLIINSISQLKLCQKKLKKNFFLLSISKDLIHTSLLIFHSVLLIIKNQIYLILIVYCTALVMSAAFL